jgi:hypothetical protein
VLDIFFIIFIGILLLLSVSKIFISLLFLFSNSSNDILIGKYYYFIELLLKSPRTFAFSFYYFSLFSYFKSYAETGAKNCPPIVAF